MPYAQYNLGQLRTYLRERLGSTLTAFYRDAELNGVLQEALRSFNLLTGFWRTRQLLPTVAGQHWYVISGSITSSLRVSFNDHPLIYAARTDLDTGQQYWESESATDPSNPPAGGTVVPDEPQVYCVGALNLLGIWPADLTSGANQLMVDGIAATPLLTTDATAVDLGEEELNTILDYAEHVCLFKEGGAEFTSTLPSDDNANALFASFLKGCAQRSGMIARMEAYRQWMGGNTAERQKNPLRRNEKVGAR